MTAERVGGPTGLDSAGGHPPIRWLPVACLRPNAKNPRKHSKRQIKLIAASIRKFGFLNPIIIDENNAVLAGHGRLEAGLQQGLTQVPTVCFSHLTPLQKRAYLIADNKIAEEAGWDRELLAIELGDLTELLPLEGLDVSITGFAVPEVDTILSDLASSKPLQEDDLQPLSRIPVTQKGDLWLLGKHRLLCGDAQNPKSFIRLLYGVSATAVFCDPPYNVRVSTIGGRGRVQHGEFAFASGEMNADQFRRFLSKTLTNGIRVSKPGAVHFICMDWRHIDDLIVVGRKIFGAMLNLAVWNKSNAGQGSFYRSQHELVGIFRVGEEPHKNNIELGSFGRNRSNVWTYPGVNTFGRQRLEALAMHPTVKPTAMVADALLDCTARGDAVLDQFAGSGTIFLAAEKVGRIAYGMEIDPRYVDVAIRRWQGVTKLEATLADDGRTFEEIEEIRLKVPIDASAVSSVRVNTDG